MLHILVCNVFNKHFFNIFLQREQSAPAAEKKKVGATVSCTRPNKYIPTVDEEHVTLMVVGWVM